MTDKYKNSPRGGAPQKSEVLKHDNARALVLWMMFKDYPEGQRRELTTRKAIQLAQTLWKQKELEGKALNPRYKNLTSIVFKKASFATLEQSVSRGKKFWEIDEAWNSKNCEAYFESPEKSNEFNESVLEKLLTFSKAT